MARHSAREREQAAYGFEDLVEEIVYSHEAGFSKPDPRIFLEALGRLGVAPADALHVGDRDGTDGAGARAAGIDVRIVDRTGAVPGRDTIAALTHVLGLL